jgi:hypothetical protein
MENAQERSIYRQLLSAGAFAARAGVNAHTLAHWRWKLQREEAPAAASPAVSFIDVTQALEEAVARGVEPLEMVCANGWLVRVPREFDAASLLRLLEAPEGG